MKKTTPYRQSNYFIDYFFSALRKSVEIINDE